MNTVNRYHHGNLRDAILTRSAEVIGEQGIEALSLRGIARDLGVSHGAPNRHFKTKAELLTELGTQAWLSAKSATLSAAETCGSNDPNVRLNAMGRGYLGWALNNGPLLAVIQHPDIARYATEKLDQAMIEFQETLLAAVQETQKAGRHPDVDTRLLTLFTNSVPYGLAALMHDRRNLEVAGGLSQDEMIAELIELVVPIKHLQSD